MNGWRQAVAGIFAALLSSTVLLGSLSLTLVESGAHLALAPTKIPTEQPTATPVTPVATAAPGEPTFTPTFTPEPTATATFPPPPTTCPPPQGWSPVMVQLGDSLAGLAQVYGTSAQELASANCLLTDTLLPGIILYVPYVPPTPTTAVTVPPPTAIPCGPPAGWVQYIVRRGDTLSALSRALGVKVAQLQNANCLGRSITIRAGSVLYVPFLPPIPATATKAATVAPSPTAIPPTAVPPTSIPPTKPLPTATTAPTHQPPPPTNTSLPPTTTPVTPKPTTPPTATPVPPTATPLPPTATSVPPTATSQPPTATSVPPTATPPPTATSVPPTATPPPPPTATTEILPVTAPPEVTDAPTVGPGPEQRPERTNQHSIRILHQ